MNITCGTDIVEIDRIKAAVKKTPAFLDRIFTAGEQSYCMTKKAGHFSSLSARFAAKEAVAKALGTGFGSTTNPLEIEILNDSYGKPYILLNGKTKETFESMGAENIDISLSHSRDYAIAFAVITYKEEKHG